MLKSLEVSNFRGFKKLTVEGWSRLNLVAGKNNTGKTAFLEALFLHLGPLEPHLATSFSHRGESRSSVPMLPLGLRYEDEWQALFFDRVISNPVVLASVMSDDARQELIISLREAQVQTIEPVPRRATEPSEEGGAATTQETPLHIHDERRSDGGVRCNAVAARHRKCAPREIEDHAKLYGKVVAA